MPPSAAFASWTKPARARRRREVGDDRNRVVPDLRPRRPRPCRASRPQIATCTPSAASARATPNPRPFDAAATAARRPAIPRSIASACPTASGWGRQCRAATRPAAGPRRDDLGADRDRGLLGGAGADVETDRRHHPPDLGVGEPRLAQPLDRGPRASGASPSRRCTRPWSRTAATIAGTSNLWSWVSTQTRRAAELGADLVEVAVGPVVHDLVGHREPRTVANTARASHTVTR